MADSSLPFISPLGDSAVLVRLGERIDEPTFRQVRALAQRIACNPFPGLIEQTPAFTTLALHYDPAKASFAEVRAFVEQRASSLDEVAGEPPRVVEIPVRYGGESGPDLEFVAQHTGLSTNEVIDLHTRPDYLVHMIGFAPGFPYLGGLPERLATPRRDSPRLKIPAGSVGIAGSQTGVYPIETPGGWQLIGRTPLPLFRPWDDPPSLLRAGDVVRFRPIDDSQYQSLKEQAVARQDPRQDCSP